MPNKPFDYGPKLPTGQHAHHPTDDSDSPFIRPVRRSYSHKKCGTVTTMGQGIAETYAKNPKYYGSTFCCGCKDYFPVAEFVWVAVNEDMDDASTLVTVDGLTELEVGS